MSGIILDGRYLLAREALDQLGEYAGRDSAFVETLWSELIEHTALMQEFMYYIDHHVFADQFDCRGYRMTDIYVFQMSRYNLIRDIGKNTESCNKEYLVLGAFHDMACMIKDPDKYEKKLLNGPGNDRL